MVYVFAPAFATILLSSVFAESEIQVWLLTLKAAVSEGPFGTVIGTQLTALFQLPEAGVADHVALPAEAVPGAESASAKTAVAETTIRVRRRSDEEGASARGRVAIRDKGIG
jgi:hypothetical protein